MWITQGVYYGIPVQELQQACFAQGILEARGFVRPADEMGVSQTRAGPNRDLGMFRDYEGGYGGPNQ